MILSRAVVRPLAGPAVRRRPTLIGCPGWTGGRSPLTTSSRPPWEIRRRRWGGPGEPIVRFGPRDPINRDVAWAAMSEDTRRDWEALGWTAANWQHGVGVWSEACDWLDLEAATKAFAAARRLGYDGHSWEADDDATYAKDWLGSRDGDTGTIKAMLLLTAVFFGVGHVLNWFDERRWRKLGVTEAERGRLKAYVVKTTKRADLDKTNMTDDEFDEGAAFYLRRLRALFEKLADRGTGTISRDSWDRACGASDPGLWGEEEDLDVATLLFAAADLADDEVLSFREFAQIAVLFSSGVFFF